MAAKPYVLCYGTDKISTAVIMALAQAPAELVRNVQVINVIPLPEFRRTYAAVSRVVKSVPSLLLADADKPLTGIQVLQWLENEVRSIAGFTNATEETDTLASLSVDEMRPGIASDSYSFLPETPEERAAEKFKPDNLLESVAPISHSYTNMNDPNAWKNAFDSDGPAVTPGVRPPSMAGMGSTVVDQLRGPSNNGITGRVTARQTEVESRLKHMEDQRKMDFAVTKPVMMPQALKSRQTKGT